MGPAGVGDLRNEELEAAEDDDPLRLRHGHTLMPRTCEGVELKQGLPPNDCVHHPQPKLHHQLLGDQDP